MGTIIDRDLVDIDHILVCSTAPYIKTGSSLSNRLYTRQHLNYLQHIFLSQHHRNLI